jgi:hypothetical protein
MTEVAPYATDHDDDSKRIASSYSYDLPNQEPNQEDKDDDDISFVPPDILTAVDALTMFFNEWEDEMNTNFDDCYNISIIAPSSLNFINGLITYINEDLTMYFNEWEEDLPDQANSGNKIEYKYSR